MGNVITLVDSTFFRGVVKIDEYIIDTDFGQLKIAASKIWYIEYRSVDFDGEDAVHLSNGSAFHGNLLPDTIPIEISSQDFEFPKSDIKFIVLAAGRTGVVSDETKSKLQGLKLL